MSILGAAALIAFPLLMAYAAFSDLFTMTISNAISLALVAIFIIVALMSGMPATTLLATHLATGAAVLVLTFIFFVRGWIGGGDAKLAAATAVWLGWGNLADYGLLASLLGAALTIGILMLRKRELPGVLARQGWVVRLHAAGNGVPYGIALAIAGLFVYPDTAIFRFVLSEAARPLAG